MKNIIAIVIIISSIILLLNKRLGIFSSWVKINAKIIGVNNLNKNRLDYEYIINSEKFDGYLIDTPDNIKNILKNNLIVYYHKINPELSIRNIPLNIDDYILFMVSIIGGLYLYLFSCESCEVPKLNSIISERIIKPSTFN